jgi:hypothetical protein
MGQGAQRAILQTRGGESSNDVTCLKTLALDILLMSSALRFRVLFGHSLAAIEARRYTLSPLLLSRR